MCRTVQCPVPPRKCSIYQLISMVEQEPMLQSTNISSIPQSIFHSKVRSTHLMFSQTINIFSITQFIKKENIKLLQCFLYNFFLSQICLKNGRDWHSQKHIHDIYVTGINGKNMEISLYLPFFMNWVILKILMV